MRLWTEMLGLHAEAIEAVGAMTLALRAQIKRFQFSSSYAFKLRWSSLVAPMEASIKSREEGEGVWEVFLGLSVYNGGGIFYGRGIRIYVNRGQKFVGKKRSIFS